MSKNNFDPEGSIQGSFLDILGAEDQGAFDISLKVKDTLTEALRKFCKKNRQNTRFDAAAQLSKAINKDVAKTTLDAYCADSKDLMFPAEYVPALIRITGDDALLRVLATPINYEVLSPREAAYARIAMLDKKIEEMRRQKELLLRGAK